MRGIDLTNKRFGSFVVLGIGEPLASGRRRWKCQCDCGNVESVLPHHLNKGFQSRCSVCVQNNRKYIVKHYQCDTRLYRTWADMLQRCSNPKSGNYKYYGAKGISVCDAWKEFIGFRDWAMSAGYDDTLTIDRIDSTGDYEPENCRWISPSENKRRGAFSRWKKHHEGARL